MKAIALTIVTGLAVLWLLGASAAAESFSLVSPDHPSVFYNRAGDKVSQQLTWDESKQELVSHVAYSRVNYTPLQDQTLYDTFHLSFPMVRLDRSTDQLYFVDKGEHRVVIGHLESGALGSRVVLNDNITFSAHRHDGVLRAAIASGGDVER